jgi:hypothetical protein
MLQSYQLYNWWWCCRHRHYNTLNHNYSTYYSILACFIRGPQPISNLWRTLSFRLSFLKPETANNNNCASMLYLKRTMCWPRGPRST